jgi:predicted alpha/beta superfamily hydrolase
MKTKYLLISGVFFFLTAISCNWHDLPEKDKDDLTTFLTMDPFVGTSFSFYSKTVKDTFKIFICLPKNYNKDKDSYPSVYVLDANVAFDMISTLMKLISNGLDCKQAIYIGVGYKNYVVMDSLRGRDYSYPQKDGIPGSGGGKLFTAFLRNELIPYIDSAYKTKSGNNTLIGHSLGGYYVMYNLLSTAGEDKPMFKNYIAGSPFVINDQYLVDLEQKLSTQTDSLPVKLFMCSGTIGDVDSMLIVFTDILKRRNYKGFEFKSIVLNDFDHMDMIFPTWSKGLRYILTNE